jgi:hypothetical protein
MATEQPTAGDSGASSADPIDRIEAFLAASDGDSTGQPDDAGDSGAEPTDAADPTGEPKDGVPGEEKEPQFTTAHLAQFLGIDESMVDVDEAGQPVFKTKIDGKEQPAKFSDFLKNHQLTGHAENRVREVAQREAALQTRLQEADQQLQARFQQFDAGLQEVAQLTQVAQEELQREFQAIDWNTLRHTDPGEFAAKQQEFQNRNARLQNVYGTLNQKRAQALEAAKEQQAALQEKAFESEAQRLVTVIPEWKDSAVGDRERAAIKQWVESSAPNLARAGNMANADYIGVVRQAWKYATLQGAKPEIENKVRSAPKLVKPGQAPSNDGNAATLKSLKQQVRQTGSGGQKALEAFLLASGKA